MKRIYLIMAVLAAVVSGCTKDDVDIPAPAPKMVDVRLSTESAPEIMDALTSTRTELKGTDIHWHNGDAILVLIGNTPYKLTNVNPDGPEAVFEGKVPDTWLTGDWRYVFYPYEVVSYSVTPPQDRRNYGMSHLALPAVQPLVSGTFARNYNFSAAAFKFSENKPLYFKNIGGLVGITLTGNVTVKSIEITAPTDIVGTVYYEFSNRSNTGSNARFDYFGLHTAADIRDNPLPSPVVTLASEKGVMLDEGNPQSFYACTMFCNTAGDYTVVVETAEEKTFTYTVTTDKTFKSGQLFSLGTFDLKLSVFELDGKTIDLDPTGRESKELFLVSEESPEILNMPDWIEYTVRGNRVVVSPKMNLTMNERTAEVTISQEGETATLVLRQKFVPVVDVTTFGCDSSVTESDPFTLQDFFVEKFPSCGIRSDAGWIAVNRNGNSFTLGVAENTTGFERHGSVHVTDDDGNVVTTVSVMQTCFNYDSIMGKYTLKFGGNEVWGLTFSEYPGIASGIAVNAIDKDGTSLSSYFSDLKLDYINMSATGPVIRLKGFQYFAHSDLYLKLITAESRVIADIDAGFDLVYSSENGRISFDFVPNDVARNYSDNIWGFGFYYGSNNALWKMITTRTGDDCLTATKWGNNHEVFLPNE